MFKLKSTNWVTESAIYSHRPGRIEYANAMLDVHGHISTPTIARMSLGPNKMLVEVSETNHECFLKMLEYTKHNVEYQKKTPPNDSFSN